MISRNRVGLVIVASMSMLIWLPETLYCAQTTSKLMQNVAKALNEVIQKKYPSTDQNKFKSIESLRDVLKGDQTKINHASIGLMAGRYSIVGHPWGELLCSLVKSFKPRIILEIGTCIGISTAYIAAGLESVGSGKVLTLENCDPLVHLARQNLNILGYDLYASVMGGQVKDSLSSVLPKEYPIDIVFDDHIHEKRAVLRNFEQIYPFLADNALYIFDDIDLNENMQSAWESLKADKRINITISIALGVPYVNVPEYGDRIHPRIGLGIISKHSHEKKHIDIVVNPLQSCKSITLRKDTFVVEYYN